MNRRSLFMTMLFALMATPRLPAELFEKPEGNTLWLETCKTDADLKRWSEAAHLKMSEGLRLYRAAALSSPAPKRDCALREVLMAEQIRRMLQSDHAILEFEDLRLQQAAEKDRQKTATILDRKETVLREEIARTGQYQKLLRPGTTQGELCDANQAWCHPVRLSEARIRCRVCFGGRILDGTDRCGRDRFGT